MGHAVSDINCMVGKGSLGPKEAMVGTGGPWVGVAADTLDPGHRGASFIAYRGRHRDAGSL